MELCFYFGDTVTWTLWGKQKYDFFVIIVSFIGNFPVYVDKRNIFVLRYKK